MDPRALLRAAAYRSNGSLKTKMNLQSNSNKKRKFPPFAALTAGINKLTVINSF